MIVELLLIFSEIVGKGTSVRSRAQIQTCYECETIYTEGNELNSISFKSDL
jgi:hypothetical protein